MTDNAQKHPDKDQLLSFGLGKLGPDESEKIAQHLDDCADCSETIVNLQDDTFVSLVRSSPAPAPVDESEVDADESQAAHPDVTVDVASGLSGDDKGPPVELPAEPLNHPRYEILELIGRGGMGDVYKAQHKVMNRVVTLKVIKPELVKNDAAVDRFRREVQAAARLRHANIVTAHDAEQAGNLHFLVMEYVDGTNLDEVVSASGRLAVTEACDYIRQAAEGLQHAHDLGMVHRDIKPHNLMIERQTGTIIGHATVVKILDFGLANFANEVAAEQLSAADENDAEANVSQDLPPGASIVRQLTQMGTMMGTPDYIAPEQAEDAHAVDIRADIYSLGCTFYTLLTGRAPFSEGSVLEKIKAHAQAEAKTLADYRDDVPAEVAAILNKMMAKVPVDRFQTPAEVAEALESVAVHVQSTKPETKARKATSSSPRRRRPLALTAVATLFVAIIAAVVFYIQTDNGVVRVEVTDPSLNVAIAGQTITMDDNGKPLTIRAGEQILIVRQNDSDFELVTDSFQLRRGDDVVIKVDLLPGQVVVSKNGERLNAKHLPGDQLIVNEWARLGGRWQGVSWESAHRTVDAEDLANLEILFDAERRTMTFFDDGAPDTAMGLTMVDFDPTASPKWIDVRTNVGGKNAQTMLGIYQLEADELTICLAYPGSPRPETLEMSRKPSSRRQLFVLRRGTSEDANKIGIVFDMEDGKAVLDVKGPGVDLRGPVDDVWDELPAILKKHPELAVVLDVGPYSDAASDEDQRRFNELQASLVRSGATVGRGPRLMSGTNAAVAKAKMRAGCHVPERVLWVKGVLVRRVPLYAVNPFSLGQLHRFPGFRGELICQNSDGCNFLREMCL